MDPFASRILGWEMLWQSSKPSAQSQHGRCSHGLHPFPLC